MLDFLNRGGASDRNAAVDAAQMRDAAARALFSLLGDPLAQDRDLTGVASRLLREHLARVARGEVEVTSSIPSATWNVACLGTLEELQAELSLDGTIHTWGHFISAPRAHAEAVATFTPADG